MGNEQSYTVCLKMNYMKASSNMQHSAQAA